VFRSRAALAASRGPVCGYIRKQLFSAVVEPISGEEAQKLNIHYPKHRQLCRVIVEGDILRHERWLLSALAALTGLQAPYTVMLPGNMSTLEKSSEADDMVSATSA